MLQLQSTTLGNVQLHELISALALPSRVRSILEPSPDIIALCMQT
jgi:hypothetical protein